MEENEQIHTLFGNNEQKKIVIIKLIREKRKIVYKLYKINTKINKNYIKY